MSDRIGGRPGGPADLLPQAPEETLSDAPTRKGASGGPASREAGAHAAATGPDVKDAFERQTPNLTGQALQTRLAGASPKTLAQLAKVQFASDDLAYLAQTFASLIAQNPGLNRLKRARLFARAICKRSRIRHLFAGITEPEMEQMCDAIADVLDGSPVFGQLVDNVSEGTGKING